jgi:hypothetical protein
LLFIRISPTFCYCMLKARSCPFSRQPRRGHSCHASLNNVPVPAGSRSSWAQPSPDQALESAGVATVEQQPRLDRSSRNVNPRQGQGGFLKPGINDEWTWDEDYSAKPQVKGSNISVVWYQHIPHSKSSQLVFSRFYLYF